MVIEVYKFLLKMFNEKVNKFNCDLVNFRPKNLPVEIRPKIQIPKLTVPIDSRKRFADVTESNSQNAPKQHCPPAFDTIDTTKLGTDSATSSPDREETKSNSEDSFMVIQTQEEK